MPQGMPQMPGMPGMPARMQGSPFVAAGRQDRRAEELRSDVFKQTQDQWCESWMSDGDLCDAVALVGPQGHRVPFIRAPLAAISKPLKAALYGDLLVESGFSDFHPFYMKDIDEIGINLIYTV